ncbi:hypothetical protein ADEAN_000922900 [Angomonas deanei]|uniref:Uncharacterized protein n=1 Tax=Angomonas deanei TaxID=59799 RepID=A0A7G2CRC0_9TRYP|nr:hypothetical protein ADEAN_000922900 [Angomonas deanei]
MEKTPSKRRKLETTANLSENGETLFHYQLFNIQKKINNDEHIKVSSLIFEDRKVIVPASLPQLVLLKTILLTETQPQTINNNNNEIDGTVVERIALGMLSDASLQQLQGTYGDHSNFSILANHGSQRCDLKTLWNVFDDQTNSTVQNDNFGAFFPVFAVAKQIVEDFVSLWMQQNTNNKNNPHRLFPRICFLLPGGNAHQARNDLFFRRLQHYFSPLTLLRPAAEAEAVVRRWGQGGGLLLLSIQEAVTFLGGAHLLADSVITLGRGASAWCAANSYTSPPEKKQYMFAVFSEMEVLPPSSSLRTHRFHTFCPTTLSAGDAERYESFYSLFLQYEQQEGRAPPASHKRSPYKEGTTTTTTVTRVPPSAPFGESFKLLRQNFKFYQYLDHHHHGVQWKRCMDFLRSLILHRIGGNNNNNNSQKVCLDEIVN